MKLLIGGLTIIALFSFWVTPYMLVASFNFLLLILGYRVRFQNKKLHAGLMGSAMISDLTLVLILEFQRDAIATATSFKLPLLAQLHILCSSVATALYFPVFILGVFLLSGRATPLMRRNHILIGKAALFFRTLGFLLMFSMLQKGTTS